MMLRCSVEGLIFLDLISLIVGFLYWLRIKRLHLVFQISGALFRLCNQQDGERCLAAWCDLIFNLCGSPML